MGRFFATWGRLSLLVRSFGKLSAQEECRRVVALRFVYSCEINGVVRYVGITDDVAKRGIKHLRSKEIVVAEIPGLSNLSRQDARGS
jgi:precorrin isomerase